MYTHSYNIEAFNSFSRQMMMMVDVKMVSTIIILSYYVLLVAINALTLTLW